MQPSHPEMTESESSDSTEVTEPMIPPKPTASFKSSSFFPSSSSETEGSSEQEMEISIWDDQILHQDINKTLLNKAVQEISGGCVSPIKSVLSSPWNELSSRQQNVYVRKSSQVVKAALETLAPGQEHLWQTLQKSPPYGPEEPPLKKKLWDNETVQTLIQSYNEADSNQTRKQILPLFVNDYTKEELSEMIPGLTKWRMDDARLHSAEMGAGRPVPKKKKKQNKTKQNKSTECDWIQLKPTTT